MIKNGSSILGTNFWGWSGEAKPTTPGNFWEEGDDLIGDPPHEKQGWYAIYQSDSSTIDILRNYYKSMYALMKQDE